MLESTFQHLPGVGEKSEAKLWAKGVTSWQTLIENGGVGRSLHAGVLESMGRLEDLDHNYFRKMIPGSLTWRAFESFRDHACFLDIETTGLSPERHKVTTVCIHSPKETLSFISGENMDELGSALAGYKYIASFNGARFDLPFLTRSLRLKFPQIHLDLMYPLKRLGYSGGLKNIEKQLGLTREADGVTGYDAVRLWKAYKSNRIIEVAGRKVGGEKALDLLVEYNREDTVNLETLCDFAVGKLTESCRARMKNEI